MKFVSTRNKDKTYSIEDALLAGLAPDGGLFVPETFFKVNLEKLPLDSMAVFAAEVLKGFFDESHLLPDLPQLCEKAFSFMIPLRELAKNISVLELTHGPTCAFKDVGAQFLAALVPKLKSNVKLTRMVLVATSGDTGAAVGCAFSGQPGTRVTILYPKGRISERQEKQLTCWQDNVQAFAVHGSFDDCQKIVKEAFLSESWHEMWQLISANSISLGRLLPQMIYYAYTSLKIWREKEKPTKFVVPTGNLGNALAAVWAREIGFPIEKLGLALNANRAIDNFFSSGEWSPKPTVATLANAMDVGNASNMERLRNYLGSHADVKDIFRTAVADDETIRKTIKRVYSKYEYICCPHTATAFSAASQFRWSPVVLLSTADPAKFNDIVEPIIGKPVPVPSALSEILGREAKRKEIEPNLESLSLALMDLSAK
jgi:threonine synthase